MDNLQQRVEALLKEKGYTGTPFKVKVFEGTTYVYKEDAQDNEQVFLENDVEEKALALIWATDEIDKYFVCQGVVITCDLEDALFDFFNDCDKDDCFLSYVEDIDCEIEYKNNGEFFVNGREYFVLDEYDANKKFNQYMDDYIDDCVLSEIPESYRNYFDDKAFKKDVLDSDGRGPTLATYDGEELEKMVNGTFYYIYRTN